MRSLKVKCYPILPGGDGAHNTILRLSQLSNPDIMTDRGRSIHGVERCLKPCQCVKKEHLRKDSDLKSRDLSVYLLFGAALSM